ncbi:hypothetical protein [Aliivibrio fischeri]|uniref:hypothetical protein n=1 Tax=Aliivibrio fischeri TaxID=668 RepID=UPI0012DA4C40|nr:hypothetical protein [Aliivibrio fischeri]MUJ39061.1 hypothetical protein [Aliivibrio fischeri]
MKITKIIFLIIFSIALKAFAFDKTHYKNNDGELVILGEIYPNVLKKNSSLNISLTQFMDKYALEYTNINGRNVYFTFNKKDPEIIDCIYNNSREINNGFLNRNAICGLNLEINTAINNYSNIINEVSKKEINFNLNRDINNELIDTNNITLNVYKNNNITININYSTLDNYIDAIPYITIKKGNNKVLESKNYFIEYIKTDRDYVINNVIYNNNMKYEIYSIANNIIFSCVLDNNKKVTIKNKNNQNQYIYKNNNSIELQYPLSNEKPISFDNGKDTISFSRGGYVYYITKKKINDYKLSVKNDNKIIFNKICKNILTPFPSNINEYFN